MQDEISYWKETIIDELRTLRNNKKLFNFLERKFNFFFNRKINNISDNLTTLDFLDYQNLVKDKLYFMNICHAACPSYLNKSAIIFNRYILKFKNIDKTEQLSVPSIYFLMKYHSYSAIYYLKELCKKY